MEDYKESFPEADLPKQGVYQQGGADVLLETLGH